MDRIMSLIVIVMIATVVSVSGIDNGRVDADVNGDDHCRGDVKAHDEVMKVCDDVRVDADVGHVDEEWRLDRKADDVVDNAMEANDRGMDVGMLSDEKEIGDGGPGRAEAIDKDQIGSEMHRFDLGATTEAAKLALEKEWESRFESFKGETARDIEALKSEHSSALEAFVLEHSAKLTSLASSHAAELSELKDRQTLLRESAIRDLNVDHAALIERIKQDSSQAALRLSTAGPNDIHDKQLSDLTAVDSVNEPPTHNPLTTPRVKRLLAAADRAKYAWGMVGVAIGVVLIVLVAMVHNILCGGKVPAIRLTPGLLSSRSYCAFSAVAIVAAVSCVLSCAAAITVMAFRNAMPQLDTSFLGLPLDLCCNILVLVFLLILIVTGVGAMRARLLRLCETIRALQTPIDPFTVLGPERQIHF